MQDIHTHLYWESFDADRDQVIARAREAGVTEMLVVGTSVEENEQALALAEEQAGVFASVGVHPNLFREPIEEDWFERFSLQVDHEKVVAIGECGLDYSESHGGITETEKKEQRIGFIRQLEVAAEKQLPLIVHCRATSAVSDDAYWDLLEILKDWAPKIPYGILHCYMGSVSVTEIFLSIPNLYFSFTANITYPVKKEHLQGNFDITEVVKRVPRERIFAETDCPFLAPQSKRGKRNEPAFVRETVEKIAALHQVQRAALEDQLDVNFKRVFLRESPEE